MRRRPLRLATDVRVGSLLDGVRDLVDVHYPKAECIRVVLDNLSTHRAKNLYEAFAPEEARRILRRLEFHYTPTHASWLNMVEIEISVLASQPSRNSFPKSKQRISVKRTMRTGPRASGSDPTSQRAAVQRKEQPFMALAGHPGGAHGNSGSLKSDRLVACWQREPQHLPHSAGMSAP